MSTDLSKFDNAWYRPGSAIKRACWFITSAVFFRNALFPFYGLKVMLLRWFGAVMGKNIVIKTGVNIKYPWFLQVGDNAWIGENVWIDNLATVSLGKNVCLSQKSLLLSGNHDYTSRTFDLILKDIVLEDGVWIGAGCIVCGGAICRDHVVLTVCSVAIGELSAMGIYRGNPAIRVKDRVFK
jgi:putative colanic acid biosynthesis acetyltransferase WcaF